MLLIEILYGLFWYLSSFITLFILVVVGPFVSDYTRKLFYKWQCKILLYLLWPNTVVKYHPSINLNSPAVYLANHHTKFEGLFYSVLPQVSIYSLIKRSVWVFMPLSIVWWIIGFDFIDRSRAKNIVPETIKRMQRTKESVLIFPTGTRTDPSILRPKLKTGGFRIAIETQLPIIPVYNNQYQTLGSWTSTQYLICGEPIYPENHTTESLMEAYQNAMVEIHTMVQNNTKK